MFERTIEAQGLHEGENRLGILSAAALAHLGIGLAVVVATALVVPPVNVPEPHRPVFVTADRIRLDDLTPRPAAPPPRKGTNAPKPGSAIAAPPAAKETVPQATPDRLVSATPEPPTAGPDGHGDGTPGDPNGSPFGVPDGNGTVGGAGDGPGEGPVYLTGDMQRPVLLEKVEPAYPEVARRARLGGRVTVRAVVGLDGSVESVEVLASNNPIFDQSAVDAVRKWRYRPALMNGSPVRIYFTVVVDFVVR